MSSLSDIKKYIKIFQDALDQKINEADTSMRISKFLEDVLGYDMLTDFTKEFSVKDRFVDIALKLQQNLTIFIEVKQVGIPLKDKHIEQACNYASNSGVEWVILTNGIDWRLYHLTFDNGIETDLLFSIDISKDPKESIECLSLLEKKSVLKGSLNDFLDQHTSLSPENILKALLSAETMRIVRKEIRKLSGSLVPEEKLGIAIKSMIKQETWEQIGDIKVGIKIKSKKRQKKDNSDSSDVIESDSEVEAPEQISDQLD